MKQRRLSIRTILAATLFAVLSPGFLTAQQAEPVRIEFARGSSGATVKGVLRNRQQTEFILSAAQGQKMDLSLGGSALAPVGIKLFGANGTPISLVSTGNNRWTVVLAETTEFLITVNRRSAKPGRSAFSLAIAIH